MRGHLAIADFHEELTCGLILFIYFHVSFSFLFSFILFFSLNSPPTNQTSPFHSLSFSLSPFLLDHPLSLSLSGPTPLRHMARPLPISSLSFSFPDSLFSFSAYHCSHCLEDLTSSLLGHEGLPPVEPLTSVIPVAINEKCS